jgi:hypothetical protein
LVAGTKTSAIGVLWLYTRLSLNTFLTMSPVGFVLRAHGTSGVPVQVTIGPDGFVANSELDNYAAHVRLTEYLQERQADGGKALERVLPRSRKELSKSELVALIRAIHARIVWIAEHDGELSDPGRWRRLPRSEPANLSSPASERAGADRYLEPSLFTLLELAKRSSACFR